MAYLLDTHAIIWIANEPERLTHDVQNLLIQKHHKIYFSSVNIWEMAIKINLYKDNFKVDVKKLYRSLLEYGYEELPVMSQHCFALTQLPRIHNDPFDRLLIAQAMIENLTLITHDGNILKYDLVKTLKI